MADEVLSVQEMLSRTDFFGFVLDGEGPYEAAYAVGWTPHMLRTRMKDPDFLEQLDVARERRLEKYEKVLRDKALAGHFPSLQMILYNEGADRWKPPASRVQVAGTIKHEHTVAIQAAESTRILISQVDPAALQPGGAWDQVVDAEVVDDAS